MRECQKNMEKVISILAQVASTVKVDRSGIREAIVFPTFPNLGECEERHSFFAKGLSPKIVFVSLGRVLQAKDLSRTMSIGTTVAKK